jgi:hypothetical protein
VLIAIIVIVVTDDDDDDDARLTDLTLWSVPIQI